MGHTWTSRRRVETALAHQEPDRVPLDMNITLIPYVRLREYLGLPAESAAADRFFEVRPSPDVLDALGIDVTFVRMRGAKGWSAPPPLPDGSTLDEWGIGRKRIDLPNGSALLEVTHCPLQDVPAEEIDLDAYPWPDPHAPGRTAGLAEEARALYENTDLAIMGRFGGPVLEMATYLRGFEQFLMDLVLRPDFARDMLEHIADIQIAMDDAAIDAAGPYLSIYKASGDDLGMQDRPLFSQKVWCNVLLPVFARRWRANRAALNRVESKAKIMFHTDGSVRSFIPDFINNEIDLLDPVQPLCKGMELEDLKRDFGDRLAFHGAIDTQHLMPFGTPAEVEAETLRCIHALGKGGGYICGPSHFIQSDVPPENIAALCRTVQEKGRYPL